ncbi:UPF0669 protein C6orf120 homolog [Trichonephila clavata]|uniref:UPF0669 protein C6orf120 homolog n=1 Tax=Trichonephila clavata TaxID=2740835 RepID=A0A8X6HQK1_TRICU|nr:UPF0669 protein C6orf120 homolog [Trichonephila clavata]
MHILENNFILIFRFLFVCPHNVIYFSTKMKFRDKILPFLLLMLSPVCQCVEHFQESILGAVGGGNYSYYWLPQPGTVMLLLHSIEGDADLYVSSKNLKPTYDIENHDLQSTTCGAEQVRVPSYYERPVSIAVYGHPSHEVSLYELKIDVYESGAEIEEIYEDLNAEETKTAHFNKPTSVPNIPVKEDPEYEERSVFWTLLLHILQVLLDLLVD